MALGRKTGGRQKGTPNKLTGNLKEQILEAASRAGGGDIATYLHTQAIENPGPFMALLGKVLPMQVTGEDGEAIRLETIQRTVVSASRAN